VILDAVHKAQEKDVDRAFLEFVIGGDRGAGYSWNLKSNCSEDWMIKTVFVNWPYSRRNSQHFQQAWESTYGLWRKNNFTWLQDQRSQPSSLPHSLFPFLICAGLIAVRELNSPKTIR